MITDILNVDKDQIHPVFIIDFDAEGKGSFFSPPCPKFFSGEMDLPTDLSPEEIFHPEDLKSLGKLVFDISCGKVIDVVFKARISLQNKNYKIFSFLVLLYKGNEANKTAALYLIDFHDTLGESLANFFPHIVENSPCPVYLLSSEFKIIYANKAASTFLGYSRFEFLKMYATEFDFYSDEEGLGRLWRKLRKEKYLEFNSVHIRKNGMRATVHVYVFYFKAGDREYCCALTLDISKVRRHECGMLLREMVNKTHFMYIPVPVFAWKYDGSDFSLVDYNYAAETATSGKLSEFLGLSAKKFFSGDEEILGTLEKSFVQKKVIKKVGSFPIEIMKKNALFEFYFIYVAPDFVFLHARMLESSGSHGHKRHSETSVADESPNPIFKVNSDYELTYKNKASHVLVDDWFVGVGFELPPIYREIVDEVFTAKIPINKEVVFKGQSFFITASPVNHGKEVLCSGLHITDQMQIREELILAEHIFDSTVEGVVVCDKDKNIIRVNPAFEKITGYTFDMVKGKNPSMLKSGRHGREFYLDMWSEISISGKWEGEIWDRKLSGEIYPARMTINVIQDENGKIKNYVSVFSDISEIKESEREIFYKTNHDPLTGLPNRQLFNDRLSVALIQAERKNHRAAILVVDLDRFKIINDGFGHIVGDFILQESAQRLEKCVRGGDTLARVGGDEFVIIVPMISDIGDTTKVTNRVLESFREPMYIDGNELFLSASIGVAIFPDDGRSPVEIYKSADIAMLHAKSNGGNSRRFFSIEMNNDMQYKLKIELELRRALDRGQFELFYQPIVDSHQQKIVGAEALIRWHHPDFGLVMPADFIPIAEETGLIVGLNDWVMRRACADHSALKKAGFGDLYFSVNMTPHQFSSRRIVDSVFSAMKDFDMSPGNLVVEITEDSIMHNVNEVISIMEELSSTGIRFSIDDFGTGYSSLSYLKKFPFDYIKIDRSFVVDLPHDYDSSILAKSIIVLAKELGLRVISEGVDAQTQVDFFRENGNFLIQGFYYSKPLPMNELIEFLGKCDMAGPSSKD